eukprot:10336221-Alexandrium_andersonii.AAC.1
MSASLVGSEMCIRDSASAQRPLQAVSSAVDGVRKLWGPLRAQQGPPVPVSYTHLTLPTICSV